MSGSLSSFQKLVLGYYAKNKRPLPWRKTRDPYKILVSEVMLQQTQVDRVLPLYRSFISRFPTFAALARAGTKDVLSAWQGLGYNRRALYLQRAAREIVLLGMPQTVAGLEKLPGIGPYTTRAIATFAWNKPHVFIETNIRSVFIHHFFPKQNKIHDAQLIPLIEKTLDRRNPREWYFALMDYGSHLKRTVKNPSRKSKHHVIQKPYEGSNRQLRGALLRTLLEGPRSLPALTKKVKRNSSETRKALVALEKEGFITKRGTLFSLV